jgi:molybdenum cofactor guanylyltransferase
MPLSRIIVLAGGGSRRLGRDKLAVLLGGRPVLDHLLAGTLPFGGGAPFVVVGSRRPTQVPVSWAAEDPPGGGPAAGLAAGMAPVAGLDDVRPGDLICLLAGDLPFAGPVVPALLTAATGEPGLDGAVAADQAGRDQPLLGVYRAGPLLAALGPEPAGRSMRWVSADLRLGRVRCAARATLDVDTEEDLTRAAELLEGR